MRRIVLYMKTKTVSFYSQVTCEHPGCSKSFAGNLGHARCRTHPPCRILKEKSPSGTLITVVSV